MAEGDSAEIVDIVFWTPIEAELLKINVPVEKSLCCEVVEKLPRTRETRVEEFEESEREESLELGLESGKPVVLWAAVLVAVEVTIVDVSAEEAAALKLDKMLL